MLIFRVYSFKITNLSKTKSDMDLTFGKRKLSIENLALPVALGMTAMTFIKVHNCAVSKRLAFVETSKIIFIFYKKLIS